MSTKKGMTKDKIYKKISILKTDESKICYLNELEKKINIVKEDTRNAFYETLGELCEKRNDFDCAIQSYEKIGAEEKTKKLRIKKGDILIGKNKTLECIEYYKKANLSEKEIWIRIGDKELEKGNFKNAIRGYKRVGAEEKTKEAFKQWGDEYLKEQEDLHARLKRLNKSNKIKEQEDLHREEEKISTRLKIVEFALLDCYEEANLNKSNKIEELYKIANLYEKLNLNYKETGRELMKIKRRIEILKNQNRKSSLLSRFSLF